MCSSTSAPSSACSSRGSINGYHGRSASYMGSSTGVTSSCRPVPGLGLPSILALGTAWRAANDRGQLGGRSLIPLETVRASPHASQDGLARSRAGCFENCPVNTRTAITSAITIQAAQPSGPAETMSTLESAAITSAPNPAAALKVP